MKEGSEESNEQKRGTRQEGSQEDLGFFKGTFLLSFLLLVLCSLDELGNIFSSQWVCQRVGE
jgi:hypothetical protein